MSSVVIARIKLAVAVAWPLFTMATEHWVRSWIDVETIKRQLLGPAFGAAGMGMVLTTLVGSCVAQPPQQPQKHARMTIEIEDRYPGSTLTLENHAILLPWVIVGLIVAYALWGFALFLGVNSEAQKMLCLGFTISLWAGFGTYLMSAAGSFLHAEFVS